MRGIGVLFWLGAATAFGAQDYAYRFQAGQLFAYQLEIVWESGEQTEWYTGRPVIEVMKRNELDLAELHCVGRLKYCRRAKKSEKTYTDSGRDVWLATRIVLDERGERLQGRPDRQVEFLPYQMKLFITPRRMLFPELPQGVGNRTGYRRSARLFETSAAGPLATGIKLETTEGTEHNWTEGSQQDGVALSILREVGFESDKEPKLAWRYKATSRFDSERGLVTSVNGTFEVVDGAKKFPAVRIQAKLLTDDDEIKKAKTQMQADWKLIASADRPIEFKREALKLHLPRHLKQASEAQRGQWYAHLGDEHRYYVVELVQVLDRYQVRIRYKGSKETADVKVATLAEIPVDQLPQPPPGGEKKPN